MAWRLAPGARSPVCAAVLMVLAGVHPTFAQSADGGPKDQADAKDEAPQKDPKPEPTNKLETVVISSQKRTEKLKDTPVAASVVSADALEKSNATDISDINMLVPSVQLKGSFNGRVPMAMRGISTSANEAAIGLTSGVAIMIDGVPVPADSTAANELQDIRRVEVLKGPQATLGGRTASAGVINFVTQAPSRIWSGNIGVTLTDDKERRATAFVTGPLSDLLAFSVSAYGSYREYPIHNTLLDENSRSESEGARAKLLLSPDKSLDITLAARVAKGRSAGGTFTYQYISPGSTLFPFFPWNSAGVSQAVALPGINVRYGNTDYASPVAMMSRNNDRDISLNIEKRAGGHTFTSTTAYQRQTITNRQDIPAVAVYFLNELKEPVLADSPDFYNQSNIHIGSSSFSQEFKVASPLDQFMSYVGGVFYSNTRVTQDVVRAMFVNPKDDYTTSGNKTLGLYGRATWNLSDSYSLLTGLRYNRDWVRYSIDDRSGDHTSASSSAAGTLVGDLTLRRKLGTDHMVYGTFARGYKPHAFNTAQTLTDDEPLAPVKKETINHFELGSKSSLLDGRLNLNAALFNTQYRNYQVQVYDNSSIIANLILNSAGEARTRGLELDAQALAGSATRLNASLAYIDARFIRYDGAPCYTEQTEAQGCLTAANGSTSQSLAGKTMPDSPKLKLVLGADHTLAQTMTAWDLNLNAQWAYRTSANFQADQNPYTRQGSFGILNLGVNATSPDGRYKLGLFVNNVTNHFYLINAEDFWSGLWGNPSTGTGTNAVIGQPARDARRYAGVRFSMSFD